MPKLIKQVNSVILPHIISDVNYTKSVKGDIQREDYIDLIGFKAYLQDMSKIEYTILLQKPNSFGLRNTVPSVTIQVNY